MGRGPQTVKVRLREGDGRERCTRNKPGGRRQLPILHEFRNPVQDIQRRLACMSDDDDDVNPDSYDDDFDEVRRCAWLLLQMMVPIRCRWWLTPAHQGLLRAPVHLTAVMVAATPLVRCRSLCVSTHRMRGMGGSRTLTHSLRATMKVGTMSAHAVTGRGAPEAAHIDSLCAGFSVCTSSHALHEQT